MAESSIKSTPIESPSDAVGILFPFNIDEAGKLLKECFNLRHGKVVLVGELRRIAIHISFSRAGEIRPWIPIFKGAVELVIQPWYWNLDLREDVAGDVSGDNFAS
jgi:hypothetical protein